MSNPTHWAVRTVPPSLVQQYERDGWWTDATLGSMVAEWLAAAPAAEVNVWSKVRPWHGTYADIDAEARRLVALMQAAGVEPGEAVAFQLPNWREAIVAFAALAMGGYVLVPIVHIYGRKELAFILEQSGAVAYISPVAHGHVGYADIIDHVAPEQLRLHVLVDGEALGTPPSGVMRVRWSTLETTRPVTVLPRGEAASIAVIAYTSGTTSDPKGVIHDHRTLLSELRHMAGWITPGRPNLMGSPVTHATGMIGAVLGPLKVGSDIHVIDRWDPGHALEVMLEAGIGGGTGASVFLAGLFDHPSFTAAHAANMSQVGLGGAPVPVALGERAASHGVKIIRAYGSTEHPSTTGSQFADPADIRHRTDGRPMPGVEIRLIDDDGVDVQRGTAGEILSRGPDLCLGYTDETFNIAFDDDGWYHTGDIGVLDEHGCLTITDRAKDIIIRGGENLSPAEVEGALETLPGVAEVAVVAAPDARLGEHACAVIRMLPDCAPIVLSDVTAHLDARGLARQKWPEELRIVTDFARTPSGKIRKVDLRAWLRAEAEVH
ncbi:MAG: AMP-dependent synthetase and ligase [Ilumatobacteraceae bacterium]|nr:AMP-dependent synthetase and ligase [Ilumatobacteraceae bacterium]